MLKQNHKAKKKTDALDRWTISIENSPRLAAKLAQRSADSDLEPEEGATTDAARLRSLLAYLLALPLEEMLIVADWLCSGRQTTRAMLKRWHKSQGTIKGIIAHSGIEELLLAMSGDSRGGQGQRLAAHYAPPPTPPPG